jgi:hypothetical protein
MQLSGRGGMSMMGLTPEGLKNLVFSAEAMGGGSTGTALMSAFQKFLGGTMKQTSMIELMKLGLVDESKVKFNKSGIPKQFQPGAIPIASLLQQDPLAFADALAKAMKEKKGNDPNNIKAVTEVLSVLIGGQGRTAGNLIAQLILMRDQIKKDASIVNQAKGINEQYALSLKSITGQIEEMKAARENFRATLGQGVLGIEGAALKELQPVVKGLTNFLMRHPEAAKMAGAMLLISKGLGGIAKSAAILKMSGLLSVFSGRSAAAPASMLSSAEIASIFGPGTKVSVAGRAAGASLGASIGGGMVAGIGAAILAGFIAEHFATQANRDEAKTAGLELGKAIKDGLLEEFRAGTEEAKKEIRKLRAAAEAKLRVKSLQLDKGPNERGMFEDIPGVFLALRNLKHADPTSKEHSSSLGWLTQRLKELQLRTPEDISAFLKESRETMNKGGAGELYGPLENTIQRMYPGLFEMAKGQMEAEAKLEASAKGAATGIDSMTRAVGLFASQVGGGVPGVGLPAGNRQFKLGGLGKEFNLPSRASGGHVLSDGLAKIHRGEDIVPVHVTRRLTNEASYAAKTSNQQIHLNMPISVDARGASNPAEIEAAAIRGINAVKDRLFCEVEDYLDQKFRDTMLLV